MFTIIQHRRRHVCESEQILTKKGMEIIFLDAQMGYDYLQRDDHLRHMNALDYSIRMRMSISLNNYEEMRDRYRLFLKNQCLNWYASERYAFLRIIQEIESLISHSLPGLLPSRVTMIKTTGKQEFGALYTSREALVLPRVEVVSGVILRFFPPAHRNMLKVLAHEMFHIFSFLNPDRRKKLYRIIGFEIAESVQLHPNLDRLRINNPDTHDIIPLIQVSNRETGRPFTAALLTISRYPEFVLGKKHLRQYAIARLFEMKCVNGVWQNVVSKEGCIKGYRFDDVSGFYEQVGTNTDYLIHPDEILAENVAIILMGKSKSDNIVTNRLNKSILRKITSIINA